MRVLCILERSSDIEISSAPLNVEGSDGISDLIMINADDTNMDTFTTLPIEFDSSNSSIETMESIEETIHVESNPPMLTDIAEETIYETEFFEESIKSELEKSDHMKSKLQVDDISDIQMEVNSILKPEESIEELSEDHLSEFEKNTENLSQLDSKSGTFYNPNDLMNCDDNSNTTDEHIYMTLTSNNSTETSNTISSANNKNEPKIVSNLIENITIKNSSRGIVEVLPGGSKNNTSSLINLNSTTNKKLSALKPIAVQNTSKFVPISIAPNPMKRPATISIGQANTNVSYH